MGFDTKYRPMTFDDVLGQKATIKILKQFVKTGNGFQQSYLFAGPYGSGKTTLGRILARALLCDNPNDGNPCDECPSCLAVLEGASETFVEFDAATNSGKSEIKKITEEIQYATFTGKRRIYLMDESHRLTKDALDALLKPLEEDIPGTRDKKLVCIFCTTEPEKMRSTILSRCAPTFVIETLKPEVIGERLAYVCDQESLTYEREALNLIAELCECHVRDALKAVEGVSMLGSVDRTNVNTYLHLDLNDSYLEILLHLEDDLKRSIQLVEELSQRVAPTTIYEKLADVSLLAFKIFLGVEKSPPAYWNLERLKEVGEKYENQLLSFAQRFADRPGRPTSSMIICDLASLKRFPVIQDRTPTIGSSKGSNLKIQKVQGSGKIGSGQVVVSRDGAAIVDPRAVRQRSQAVAKEDEYTIQEFSQLLELKLQDLGIETDGGSQR